MAQSVRLLGACSDCRNLGLELVSSMHVAGQGVMLNYAGNACEACDLPVTVNIESLETAESWPMQYNNFGLKLSFFGKYHSLYDCKFTRLL